MKRIKIGLCTGFDNFELAAELGFDYVECSLSALAALSEEEFARLRQKKPSWKIPLESCNGMIPGGVPCVGPDASDEALREYLGRAFRRAMLLQVRIVVFGSGASRGVPAGWSHEQAWRQIVHFLKIAAEEARKARIQISIEPLRRKECNIINYVSEATALAAIVDDPAIGVLGDTFHMNAVGEPYEALTYAGDMLKHVHISHSPARTFPKEGDGEDYAALFEVLGRLEYEGGVSIEAGTNDLRADGEAALRCLWDAMKVNGMFLLTRKELEEYERVLRARLMGGPMPVTFAIAPVPGYLYGRVPLDVIQERSLNALQYIDLANDEIKEALAESYPEECEMVRGIIRTFGKGDVQTAEGENVFKKELLAALKSYLAKPESERKSFIL